MAIRILHGLVTIYKEVRAAVSQSFYLFHDDINYGFVVPNLKKKKLLTFHFYGPEPVHI